MIRLHSVQKTYLSVQGGKETIFRDLNLHISQGSRTIVTGDSGCGKTTLLKILALIDEGFEGELVIDGEPLSRCKDAARARFRRTRLGFIFQDFALIPELTVLENVMVPLVLTGMRRRQAREQAALWLEKVGLSQDKGGHCAKYPIELSGGQQQRVGIARALSHRPKVILADEPTGNLDGNTTDAVMELILGCCEEVGSTFVMVTHDKRMLRHATDHIHISREVGKAAQIHCEAFR